MGDPSTISEAAGLQLSNNTFSASPPGSLRRARNCIINSKGVAEHRNGQRWLATLASGASFIPWALGDFQGASIVNAATELASDAYSLSHGNGVAVEYAGGPYNPVGERMRFAAFNQFLNFCTTGGPKVLEAFDGTPRAAGLLRMPSFRADLSSTAATPAAQGFLPYNASVAFRTVLRRITRTGVSLLSPPSGRTVVVNRVLVPAGGLVRTSSSLVTATLPASPQNLPLTPGDTFVLTPGEPDFLAGTYTVTGVSGFTFTYASLGSDVASTLAQDANSGARGVTAIAQLPSDAAAGDAVRLYRTRYTSSSAIAPDDELYLVGEKYVDAGAITAGLLVFEDNTPQTVLADPLYTNPQTGEGAAQANLQPPLYRDLASWSQVLWYANTTGQQELRLQLLGVGTPAGVQDGDTLTIDDGTTSKTWTFKDAPTVPYDVPIFSAGLPAQNISDTASYFAYVAGTAANGFPGIGVYYVSADDEGPGKLLIQRTDFGAQFGVTVSRPASWTPALTVSTATLSDNARAPNQLAYSKLAQGEAVPPVNYMPVGAANYGITRILGLRNSLLVFKDGDGIYSVSGGAPFLVEQIATANITAPNACAVFADSAWVYTDQGILRVSDSGGATVVSRPIETELNRLFALQPNDTRAYAFAVPYEVERRIMFFVPVGELDDAIRPVLQAFCFSQATNAWTGPLEFNELPYCGLVDSMTRKLLLGVYDTENATSRVTVERKGSTPAYLDKADADRDGTISVVEVDGNPLYVQFLLPVAIGTGVQQGQWRSKVVRYVHSTNVYELADAVPWEVGACTLFEPYPVDLAWQPQGSPTARKTLTRLSNYFQPGGYGSVLANVTLETDQLQAVTNIAAPALGFGRSSFGIGPFGDPSPLVVDTNPPAAPWANAAQFFPGIAFEEVWCAFRIQGVGLKLDGVEAPVGRGR